LTEDIRVKLKDFYYGSRPGQRADSEFKDEIVVVEGGIGEKGYMYLGETKRGTNERHGMGKAVYQKNDAISIFEGWWKDDE